MSDFFKRLLPIGSRMHPEMPMLKPVETEASVNTKWIIEKIHDEFNTAGDRALREAKEILSGLQVINEDKASRLKKLGFSRVNEVMTFDRLSKEKKMHEDTASALSEMNFKYPKYKFITQEMADEICKKYNLVIGDISLYTGFVPEKNLKDIEEFDKQDNDLSNYYLSTNFMYGSASIRELTREEYQEHVDDDERINNLYIKSGATTRMRDVGYSKLKRPLEIAAPIKDMDTMGYKLEGNKLKMEIPDPVILAPIKIKGIDLYCIVTAWGDEASDEIVVNQKNN
jgi:hypothetical protein